MGTIIELLSLSKDAIFGKYQRMLYKTVFLPRLLFNCETWTNLSDNDFSNLQKVKLNYLRRIMEVPRSAPIHRTFLELGILQIQFDIEQRQLCYLKYLSRMKMILFLKYIRKCSSITVKETGLIWSYGLIWTDMAYEKV